mmetsp:Transcript_22798/g.63442  ORF Transcript_22798/g.63442 Transcript_22798/m.63442 type:complete len:268 (+) Transcript_22798:473-1276(+)
MTRRGPARRPAWGRPGPWERGDPHAVARAWAASHPRCPGCRNRARRPSNTPFGLGACQAESLRTTSGRQLPDVASRTRRMSTSLQGATTASCASARSRRRSARWRAAPAWSSRASAWSSGSPPRRSAPLACPRPPCRRRRCTAAGSRTGVQLDRSARAATGTGHRLCMARAATGRGRYLHLPRAVTGTGLPCTPNLLPALGRVASGMVKPLLGKALGMEHLRLAGRHPWDTRLAKARRNTPSGSGRCPRAPRWRTSATPSARAASSP